MRVLCSTKRDRGIALILVLISVVVLAVLAAGFAYSMRVELKLARNANSERELEWLGRSGVELARYVLGQQLMIAGEPYDALNQRWAGGPGSIALSNSPLMDIRLEDVELGGGHISVKIVDCERKMNINLAPEPMLHQAMAMIGLDAGGAQTVVASIMDWIDPDDLTRIGGAERDFYESRDPSYVPKNGPIDDLSEMLLIQGVTPDLLWGAANTNSSFSSFQAKRSGVAGIRAREMPSFTVGLADLFVPVSSGRININTASPVVLGMLPFMDENYVQEIIRLRAGEDGVEGTDDDTPWQNVGELGRYIPDPQMQQSFMQFCDVRSRVFEVTVDAEIDSYRRRFVALLARDNPRSIHILTFSSR